MFAPIIRRATILIRKILRALTPKVKHSLADNNRISSKTGKSAENNSQLATVKSNILVFLKLLPDISGKVVIKFWVIDISGKVMEGDRE
jgi:hypothetical protein